MRFMCLHRFRTALFAVLASLILADDVSNLAAADFFLTIGGGYNPSGNQASLEANVVFYKQLLADKHRGSMPHDVFFADGNDATADLQVIATKSVKTDQPATDLLASLHRRRGQERVEYRNHQVPDIAGELNPSLIRASLDSIGRTAKRGDRLIIYVTAHGSEGPQADAYNTTIDCWNEKKITAREFTGWLNRVPVDVPVLMVMAQCYCGGFARTIFDDLNVKHGLSPHLRAGFFAQQHNLPAAGCRPDIEHDEEFSSYFWGAIAGHSRTGTPLKNCDVDGNGVVSFAEAYAYAVWAGETIDIPLRTSDVFLRTYSRLTVETSQTLSAASEDKSNSGTGDEANLKPSSQTPLDSSQAPDLSTIGGTIQSYIDRGRPVSRRIVTELCRVLEIPLTDDVSLVLTGYDEHRDSPRTPIRGRGGRRGPGAGRRDLLREISEKWPELGDERHWEESTLLKPDNQEQLFAELKELPSWKAYDERRRPTETPADQSGKHELREVKFRRLIKTLELIILEQNLPLVATKEIVERYRQMMELEESSLETDGVTVK